MRKIILSLIFLLVPALCWGQQVISPKYSIDPTVKLRLDFNKNFYDTGSQQLVVFNNGVNFGVGTPLNLGTHVCDFTTDPGSSDWVSVTSDTLIPLDQDFSISFWLNVYWNYGSLQGLFIFGDSGLNTDTMLYSYVDGSGTFWFGYIGSDDNYYSPSFTPADYTPINNKYAHIVLARNAANDEVYIYLNGVKQTVSGGSIAVGVKNITGKTWYLGNYTTAYPCLGFIDNFKVIIGKDITNGGAATIPYGPEN